MSPSGNARETQLDECLGILCTTASCWIRACFADRKHGLRGTAPSHPHRRRRTPNDAVQGARRKPGLERRCAAQGVVDSVVKTAAGRVGCGPASYEQKMLSRSSRMVVGSREKAKSSTAVWCFARKVQREAGDMQKAIN